MFLKSVEHEWHNLINLWENLFIKHLIKNKSLFYLLPKDLSLIYYQNKIILRK